MNQTLIDQRSLLRSRTTAPQQHYYGYLPDVAGKGKIQKIDTDTGSNEERAESSAGASPTTGKPKRSTVKGEARVKLIAALTLHHRYADGSCMNCEPIGVNQLARNAEVSPSSASVFVSKKIPGSIGNR